MKIKNKNSGYTVLITLMLVGFLIVLTTGTLNLVLRELKDNKANGNYLKAFAGAEGAMELALLEIKQNGYGIYNKIDFGDQDAKILRNNKNDKKEILISYDLNSKTKTYVGILKPFEQVVIPLFYMKKSPSGLIEHKIKNLNLKILDYYSNGDEKKMAYNIVSSKGDGIGGAGEISVFSQAQGRYGNGRFLDKVNINGNGGFLYSHNFSYLIVVNLDNSNNLKFKVTSTEYFTKPISKIISSAKIMKYKQNLETTLDNTKFLSILKYSIYSE